MTPPEPIKPNRRAVLTGAAAIAATTALGGATTSCATAGSSAPSSTSGSSSSPASEPEGAPSPMASARLPVIYLPHGGGPWPFVEGIGDPDENARLTRYLEEVGRTTASGARPSALLVISAHWEERAPTVMTSARPPMLYDYYGFPPASYEITWPAPGDPALASRVRALLSEAGIESAEDGARGFDHGTFVPLKLAYPAADIPTIQLSLVAGLDPTTHLRIGRALRPLRDEGVLIVGSGMSFHNMRAFFGGGGRREAIAFDGWLAETAAQPAADRDRALTAWSSAPGARMCHPREEHLLPLMVIAGAAGEDRGHLPFRDSVLGMPVAAVHFG